jgi:hypothetical protein
MSCNCAGLNSSEKKLSSCVGTGSPKSAVAQMIFASVSSMYEAIIFCISSRNKNFSRSFNNCCLLKGVFIFPKTLRSNSKNELSGMVIHADFQNSTGRKVLFFIRCSTAVLNIYNPVLSKISGG